VVLGVHVRRRGRRDSRLDAWNVFTRISVYGTVERTAAQRGTLLYNCRVTCRYLVNNRQEGLAVASIARDVAIEMTLPRDDNAR